MMDANSTREDDRSFNEFVQECSLHDLYDTDPAPSTFIGAADRRIDYIFGCIHAKELVQRSGTLSYFEGPQSDHRALFIDIKDPSFLHKAQASPISKERALHSGNPELMKKYQESMLKYYSDHRMVERIDHLHQHFSTMPLDDIRPELKKWDEDQGRAMSLGEKSISRPPKLYQWSPKLRNAALMRMYWKLRLRELTHTCNYQQTFIRWQQRL